MTEPFLGEIQAFGFGFNPEKWLPCDGRLLSIQSNSALFSLIGSRYGGDGTSNFALPNLIGNVVVSQGQSPGGSFYKIGERVGANEVTLLTAELPAHTHLLQLGDRTSGNPTAVPSATANVAIDPSFNGFVKGPIDTSLAISGVTAAGGGQSHGNAQPTLAMIYCICVAGIFPSFG